MKQGREDGGLTVNKFFTRSVVLVGCYITGVLLQQIYLFENCLRRPHGFKKTANDEFLLRLAADCGGGQSLFVSFSFFFFLSRKQPTFWSWISLKTGNLSEYKVNAQGGLRHCDKG